MIDLYPVPLIVGLEIAGSSDAASKLLNCCNSDKLILALSNINKYELGCILTVRLLGDLN